jgi:hypothetical protein
MNSASDIRALNMYRKTAEQVFWLVFEMCLLHISVRTLMFLACSLWFSSDLSSKLVSQIKPWLSSSSSLPVTNSLFTNHSTMLTAESQNVNSII